MATPQQLDEVVNDFMTARQAAQAIGCHLRTLKNWKAAGYGPDHFYIGKRLFYRRSDVIAWLQQISATQAPVTKGRKVRA
ncbi:helix-turn-helix domain-containing protein [Luteimonas sp. 50]|uniref:Helix-turn-helix domain-containing protein n=1 Tax=Cognatiluteimonas sedimenti TaxID=2927791 RepID=A0ABT0A4Q0_9GAMM|nr:helix-turn-helix domain-containing protein [Lysobacter sedimenti]MCJ0825952.1 helix-turn-helix domain-containing protein [Lysobacter sedimenti]